MKKEASYNFNHTLSLVFISFLFIGLPLFVNRAFFNITQAKTLFFLALCVVLFIGFGFIFISDLIKKKIKPIKPNVLDLFVLLFGILYIISAILSEYQRDVWYGKNSRLQGAIIILLYVIVYFIISNNLKLLDFKTYIWKYLIAGFILTSLVAILNGFNIDLFGFFQGVDDFYLDKFISTVGNINFYSGYICLCLPILFYIYIFSENKKNDYFYLLFIALSAFSSILASSEGFTLGFIAIVAVSPFLLFDKPKELLRFIIAIGVFWISASTFLQIYNFYDSGQYTSAKTAELIFSIPITLVLLSGLSFLYYYILKHSEKISFVKKGYIIFLLVSFVLLLLAIVYANIYSFGKFDSFLKFDDKWGTNRGLIFKLCFRLIGDFSFKEILFGIGPESLQNEKIIYDELFVDQAHCEFLQNFISTGFFGLISQLGIIFSTIIILVKNKNNQICCAVALGLLAYWAQASVNIAQPLTSPFIYVYLAIISSQYKNKLF